MLKYPQSSAISPIQGAGTLGQDLPVETLAAKAGMSPRYFARVFLKDTGMTPARLVEPIEIAHRPKRSRRYEIKKEIPDES